MTADTYTISTMNIPVVFKKTGLLIVLFLTPLLSRADEVFTVALTECSARLEHRSVEPEILLVRSDCPLSLKSLAELLDTGLQGMFPAKTPDIRSIYLGRLMNYPQWSTALAQAAAKSPAWNSRKGRPMKTGENDNRRVTLLLNGPAYPQELKPVFSRYQLLPCIAEVEKVLVYKAKDIFTDDSAPSKSIPANARLPVDAQVWLRLQPISTDCSRR
ncbi:hypothetical protein MTYM_00896 [Methylococcales bacterium]|nr:hypothetical protein MTYM_00896 [Methylococcales bacterium]